MCGVGLFYSGDLIGRVLINVKLQGSTDCSMFVRDSMPIVFFFLYNRNIFAIFELLRRNDFSKDDCFKEILVFKLKTS